jgi:Flp pilus assembly protein TadG
MRLKLLHAAPRALRARQRPPTISDLPRRRSRRNQRGVAVVEFALVLPLLLLVLFSIVEFGLIMYDKAMITNASREAARSGVVYAIPYLPASAPAGTPSISAVATNYLTNNLINLGSASPSVSVPSGACAATGSQLQVVVTYKFTGMALGTKYNPLASQVNNALSLSSATTMTCE